MRFVEILICVILFAACFSAFFFLLRGCTYRHKRWKTYDLHFFLMKESKTSRWEQIIVRFYPKFTLDRYQQLLNGCGWPLRAEVYVLLKCLGIWISASIILFLWIAEHTLVSFKTLGFIILILVLFSDKWILNKTRQRRSENIAREIFEVSYHLLYYQGSKLNIHTKLMRCLPMTRVLRKEMQLLLNEWYEHAELALKRFRQRVGTEEAHSFAETIETLYVKDDGEYYELLRQRVADFKQKMALIQESRSESHSYILFILAGIPLLNTFRVFIYPWVEEGLKLFETLH